MAVAVVKQMLMTMLMRAVVSNARGVVTFTFERGSPRFPLAFRFIGHVEERDSSQQQQRAVQWFVENAVFVFNCVCL